MLVIIETTPITLSQTMGFPVGNMSIRATKQNQTNSKKNFAQIGLIGISLSTHNANCHRGNELDSTQPVVLLNVLGDRGYFVFFYMLICA